SGDVELSWRDQVVLRIGRTRLQHNDVAEGVFGRPLRFDGLGVHPPLQSQVGGAELPGEQTRKTPMRIELSVSWEIGPDALLLGRPGAPTPGPRGRVEKRKDAGGR